MEDYDEQNFEDVQQKPKIELIASVTYNKLNNRFIFDPNFFEVIGLTERVEKSLIIDRQNDVVK